MHQPGLYYPFIHVRDDDWLKVAALYWPSVHRIAPFRHVKYDTPTSLAFAEAGLLRVEDPQDLLFVMPVDLATTLRTNAHRLMRDYSLERAVADWDGTSWSTGEKVERGGTPYSPLAWLRLAKFPESFAVDLEELGLACRAWDYPGLKGPSDSIGMHPTLASAYMTALACQVSEQAIFTR